MTPAEVREILKRLWLNNADILSLLYAVENKQVPRSSKIHTKYEDTYQMFFVQTVPVAPNKFRAPSKLGDQVFEHPQNPANENPVPPPPPLLPCLGACLRQKLY